MVATILSSSTCWRGLFGLEACPWRFVIAANAGGSPLGAIRLRQRCGELAPLELPVALPSLHLMGETDGGLENQLELAEKSYVGARKYVHAHGHELPCFLAEDDMLQDRLGTFFMAMKR